MRPRGKSPEAPWTCSIIFDCSNTLNYMHNGFSCGRRISVLGAFDFGTPKGRSRGNRKEAAMKWLYLLIAISAEVAATTALKASHGLTKLAPSAIVVFGYGVAFYFLSLTLDSIPIGISYAVWSGVGIVFITLIGWRFFDQSLDAPAMIGVALIIAGVAVINLLSKSASH
jgi:small multidrug resistance pump